MEAYKVASQTVTVPGASEHQIGLALDCLLFYFLSVSSTSYRYLSQNSSRQMSSSCITAAASLPTYLKCHGSYSMLVIYSFSAG